MRCNRKTLIILSTMMLFIGCKNNNNKTEVKLSAPNISSVTTLVVNQGTTIPKKEFPNKGGAIDSCSVLPTLPTGLLLNKKTCSITGKPTKVQALKEYTVSAKNATGSDTATISITINSRPITSFMAKDTLLPDQWYIHNTGNVPDTWGKFKNLKKDADMRVFGAWKQGATGEGVVVTVVDDGIDFKHPDLKTKEEGSTSVQLLRPAKVNVDDHGTACAGIIGALSDSEGVVGIAPKAKLISLQGLIDTNTTNEKVFEIYDILDLSQGKAYLKILKDNVSQVSNHSYGPDDDGKLYPLSSIIYDTIESLVLNSNNGKGHVFISASGNERAYVPKTYKASELDSSYEGDEDDNLLEVSKTYGDYAGLDLSQNSPYVFCVSSFDANDKEVSYAEAGPSVLVAGATGDRNPGPKLRVKATKEVVEIIDVDGRTKKPAPAMATTGRHGISYPNDPSEEYTSHRDDGVKEPIGFNMAFNGTSASAPSVTGVVALILSINPKLTWRDVRWILAKTARKIQMGKTIINQATGKPSVGAFAKEIWSTTGNDTFGKYSHYFGYGVANATEAVKLAKSPDYKLLPKMSTCFISVNNGVATIPEKGCPNTVEFVEVKFQLPEGYKINDASWDMQKGTESGKIAHLIVPTTCTPKDGSSCDIEETVTTRTGTIAFLGDSLSKNDTFTFTTSNSNPKNSGDIVTQKIKIFGYNKPNSK